MCGNDGLKRAMRIWSAQYTAQSNADAGLAGLRRSALPPSVLPDISPSSGEINSFGAAAVSPSPRPCGEKVAGRPDEGQNLR